MVTRFIYFPMWFLHMVNLFPNVMFRHNSFIFTWSLHMIHMMFTQCIYFHMWLFLYDSFILMWCLHNSFIYTWFIFTWVVYMIHLFLCAVYTWFIHFHIQFTHDSFSFTWCLHNYFFHVIISHNYAYVLNVHD